METSELRKLRAIIQAFVRNINQNWNSLSDRETHDRYHELYDMVQEASKDPNFRKYVQPIPYWSVVGGNGYLLREHAVRIVNSATQLLAYLDSVISKTNQSKVDSDLSPPQQQEIAHLQKLRAKHLKNIRTLKEQLANYGMDQPLSLLNKLEFELEQLRQVEEELAAAEESLAAPAKPREVGESPNEADLNNVAIEILKKIAEENKGTVESLSSIFNMPEQKIQFYLDTLRAREFLDRPFLSSLGTEYRISSKGRKYLFEKDLP